MVPDGDMTATSASATAPQPAGLAEASPSEPKTTLPLVAEALEVPEQETQSPLMPQSSASEDAGPVHEESSSEAQTPSPKDGPVVLIADQQSDAIVESSAAANQLPLLSTPQEPRTLSQQDRWQPPQQMTQQENLGAQTSETPSNTDDNSASGSPPRRSLKRKSRDTTPWNERKAKKRSADSSPSSCTSRQDVQQITSPPESQQLQPQNVVLNNGQSSATAEQAPIFPPLRAEETVHQAQTTERPMGTEHVAKPTQSDAQPMGVVEGTVPQQADEQLMDLDQTAESQHPESQAMELDEETHSRQDESDTNVFGLNSQDQPYTPRFEPDSPMSDPEPQSVPSLSSSPTFNRVMNNTTFTPTRRVVPQFGVTTPLSASAAQQESPPSNQSESPSSFGGLTL
ncbi:hypothetical protein LTS08_005626 [Lithohypha guttulata]|nr:hypothetical protein LTS08_005626 [Lithohypha guttulata]